MKKRTIAIIITAAVIIAMLPVTVAQAGSAPIPLSTVLVDGPTGPYYNIVKGSTYSISSEDELTRLSIIYIRGIDCSGCSFLLTQNLDLTEKHSTGWAPIGSKGHPFNGQFYGQGHIISGLVLNQNNYGLFGAIGSGGVVQDLTVWGGGALEMCGASYIGAIAGVNYGTILNCSNSLSYTSGNEAGNNKSYIGGIAGQNYGIIQNCGNLGIIKGNYNATLDTYIGGIAGYSGNNSSIINCWNCGNITGDSNIGGITGGTGSSAVIRNCCNTVGVYLGRVTGNTLCGGIVGSLGDNSSLQNCYSTGTIIALSSTGGAIAGKIGQNVIAQNCYWLSGSCSVAYDASSQSTPTGFAAFSSNGGGTFSSPVYGQNTLIGALDAYVGASENSSYNLMAWSSSPGYSYPVPGGIIIISSPSDASTDIDKTADFTVTAAGQGVTYQWQVSTDNGGSWNNVTDGENADTPTYTTPAGTPSMNGYKYRCLIGGTLYSGSATLTVNSATIPEFSAQPENQNVKAGETAAFTVSATGNPTPTYQWQVCKDGSTWSDVTTGTGGDTASYTTEATTGDMNGYKYRCKATNSAGDDTSDAVTLTVNFAPHISTQPENQSIKAGNAAIFSVSSVTGNPAPTYQWQVCKDGSTWNSVTTGTGGDTANYTTEAAAAGMNGYKYHCVATNSEGNDTSAAALLTVTTDPVYTITASSGNTAYGTVSGGGTYVKDASVTLTATANAGYYFAGWYDGDTLVFSDATYKFTAAKEMTLTARFASYINITVSSGNAAYGSASGGGSFTPGTPVALTATPGPGYYFAGWYKGNALVSAGAVYTFTASESASYISQFDKIGIPVTITAAASAYNKITVRWSPVAGAKGYYIYRAIAADGTYKKIGTSKKTNYANSGITTGTTYYYKIVAYSKSYTGKFYSAVASAVSTLGKVNGVTAKSSAPAKAKIKWKTVTGAKKYQVLRSDTKDGVYTAVKTTSSKTITDSGLIPGKTYYYKIVALRGSAYGADSDIVSVTTKAVK